MSWAFWPASLPRRERHHSIGKRERLFARACVAASPAVRATSSSPATRTRSWARTAPTFASTKRIVGTCPTTP
eukprot:9024583-Pyramimonas_sp.AAC.1